MYKILQKMKGVDLTVGTIEVQEIEKDLEVEAMVEVEIMIDLEVEKEVEIDNFQEIDNQDQVQQQDIMIITSIHVRYVVEQVIH